jgi:catechol 2,3-dioxygenase-like lactoylglutathione lyase family enzyme
VSGVNAGRSPRIAQVALTTTDLPATLRLYTEVFGFAQSGGEIFWGPWLSVQALGPDAAASVWWLVGRQDLVQLELFEYSAPESRPLPDDWRPCDQGWVRWGLTVPDFDAALERLHGLGVATVTEPRAFADGLRRVCFRDPQIGVMVEVIEEGAALAGGVRPRFYDLVPAVVYATVSVGDLDAARAFYLGTVGLEEVEEPLHSAEMEELWGLSGARAEGFVARGGDVLLEVVSYAEPAGRPRPEDRALSDQGMMNVAVAHRDRASLEDLYERLVGAGYPANTELLPGAAGGTYLEDGQGNSFEILAVPREFDRLFGFVPKPRFDPIPLWPAADVPAAPDGRE